jgi:hypothetical protein
MRTTEKLRPEGALKWLASRLARVLALMEVGLGGDKMQATREAPWEPPPPAPSAPPLPPTPLPPATRSAAERVELPDPRDSPDLALLMALVSGVGGLTSWTMRRSTPGAVAGALVAAVFAHGGAQMMPEPARAVVDAPDSPLRDHRRSHEVPHMTCLMASLVFTGAMSYRAGSLPWAGPAGAMLASLGGVSALYHLDKMVAWRRWEEARMASAERLLRLQQ